MQRTVNVKAKASLRFSIMVWDLDAGYPSGYCLSYNISFKMQTQGSNHKDSHRFEKSKNKNPKPVLLYANMAEPVKKKDKKKKSPKA